MTNILQNYLYKGSCEYNIIWESSYISQLSKMSIFKEIVYENISSSVVVLIGAVYIFYAVINQFVYVHKVKQRGHALHALIPPTCEKYWSARYHLVKNINNLDPGQLFGNLDPK